MEVLLFHRNTYRNSDRDYRNSSLYYSYVLTVIAVSQRNIDRNSS